MANFDVQIKRDIENQIRGLLKNLGLVIGRAKMNVFAVRAAELTEDRLELAAAVVLLLRAREAIERQIADLDRRVMGLARNNAQVRRFLPKQPEPEPFDPDEGVDPHAKLWDIVSRYINAKEAAAAEAAAARRAQGLPEPVTDLESAKARIDELEAEIIQTAGVWITAILA